MEFNLVYGRSGTGKSEYIYKKIAENVGKEKIFLIVPEQANLSAERKLFEVTGKESLIDVEVLTLSRMAYRVNNSKELHLSKAGKNIIIYDLLDKEKENLKFLGKSEKNIDTVNKVFTELKKHNIGLQNFEGLEIRDDYLKYKMQDVKLLYESYENRIKNLYIDENDELTLLAQNLENTNEYDGASFFIDEFLGFTSQEYSVFSKLLEKAKSITCAICIDSLEFDKSKENDIFYFNKEFANKLIEIAENKGSKINKIFLKDLVKYKNSELIHLEKSLSGKYSEFEGTPDEIKIFYAANVYQEIEYIAKEIYDLVKNNGYRYREIGIISENLDGYKENIKSIFRKYEIPIFVDDKKAVNQNLLVRFVSYLLDILSNNWSFESVFNYLKVGLLDISDEDIYKLENYCLKWGIKGSKWYNRKFDYEEVNDQQEQLEIIREKIVSSILDFKNKVYENKTGYQISKEIYYFIINNHINEKLDLKVKEYGDIETSDEYNTSYKLFINILDDISAIFANEKMSFDRYRSIFEVALNSYEIGTIPATQDQVIFGDTERTRSSNIRACFVIGINDGYFPKVSESEGFLNDEDRKILKEQNFELAKDSKDCLYEEEFNIYRTLLAPNEKLYLTYSSSDKKGTSLRPSILIRKIKKIFPNISIQSDIIEKNYKKTNYKATFDEVLEIYRNYLNGEKISAEWIDEIKYFIYKDREDFQKYVLGIYYTNKAQKITEENIKALYGDMLNTSISRLESYSKCPFSYYLTYGLNIKERQEFKIEVIDTGSFMHEVIDLFFKKLDENDLNVKELSDEEIYSIISEIINKLLDTSKYYKYTSTAKFRLLTRRLKRVIYNSICYIVYTLRNSDFSILGHEVEFSNNGKYKPIELDTKMGKVKITGKIDRVDVGSFGNEQYVRIIDYKSSVKNIDRKLIEAGIQIQLITYLDAICSETEYRASGALYMSLIDNIIKDAKNYDDEKIKDEIKKQFRMKGIILADINVVKMMDRGLKDGDKSDIIPASIKKDGELAKEKSLVTKEEFDNIQKEVKEIITRISEEILSGNIDIKPYSYGNTNACNYCKYNSICMFNTTIKGNEYRYI